MSSPSAPTWDLERPNVFEVDLDAVAHNARLLRSRLGDAKIFAALKADGYGYGAETVAHTVLGNGIDGLSMVSVGTAARLRESGVTSPILLYPGVPFTAASVEVIHRHQLIPTIADRNGADILARLLQRPQTTYIKIDVGLERFGVPPEAFPELLEHIATLASIHVGGLYAHMHLPSSGWDAGYIAWQTERFQQAVKAARKRGLSPLTAMTVSTGILANETDDDVEAADPGRWFFGLVDDDIAKDEHLRPAFVSLKSQLAAVKDVSAVSYIGQSPLGSNDVRRIGIVPVGLVDGIERITSGSVLVRGKSAAMLGAPSIEHTRIDLTDIPDAAAGDPVVLIGNQGSSSISPRDVALHHKLPAPCLLALRVGPTFRRQYIHQS